MNFDYGNVLTRAFQITWRHKSFWLFLMIPMLTASVILLSFVVPVFLLEGNEDLLGLVLAVWIGVVTLGLFASLLASTAAITSLTLGILRVERGEGSTAFMDLVRDGFQYFGRALGVMLIVQLTIGLVFTVFFLCVAALIAVTMGVAAICLQPVMILLTPLSFLVSAVMNAALVAVMDEDLGAWDAVKRALQVVREHVWKFLILTLIVYFGASMLSSIVIVPAMMPAMLAPVAMEMGEQAFWLIMMLFVCLFFPLMSFFSGVIGTFTTAAVDIAYLRLAKPAGENIVFGENAPSA
jgi:hypothetical protein